MKDKNIQTPIKGLNTDSPPINQPEGTYRYALNSINSSKDGKIGMLSKESGNVPVAQLSDGYIPIGHIYITDNSIVIFSVNDSENRSEIGIFDKNSDYTLIVNSGELNFNVRHQIEGEYRLRNGERIIYWVDGLNNSRIFNLDKPSTYWSVAFTNWLENGNPESSFDGEKWNIAKFELVKIYEKIPTFENIEILYGGYIKPGSYSFAIQYLDEDLNPSNWNNTSNPVNIYSDNLKDEYHTIRGSRNIDSAVMTYGVSNKSIKLTVGNLDANYQYYRIAIIQANEMKGLATKAYVSEIKSINDPVYVYNGYDEVLTETPLEDILVEKELILAASHIEQLENRLLLSKGKVDNVNWCSFQRYASKINSHLSVKRVYLNTINDSSNPKNPISTFDSVGYMPGDVYSFGIIYLMTNGTLSPTFHIPGRNKNYVRKNNNGLDDNMDYYETTYSSYPEIHKCPSNKDYWGQDVYGEQLVNKPIRHHRFPSRGSRNIPVFDTSDEAVEIKKYTLKVKIALKDGETYPLNALTGEPLIVDYKCLYKLSDNEFTNEYSDTLNELLTYKNIEITLYSGDGTIEKINGNNGIMYGEITEHTDKFEWRFSVEEEIVETLDPAYYTDIMGIRFDNIEKPHEDVVGYYIVRQKKQNSDRLILDNAIFGLIDNRNVSDIGNYKVFNKWITTNSFSSSGTAVDNQHLYFFSPIHQFDNENLVFDDIEINGYYDLSNKMTSFNGGIPPSDSDYDRRKYSVVVEDVMEGTTFNPSVHEDNDTDGFSLLIGYRNCNGDYKNITSEYSFLQTTENESAIDDIIYLNAASNKKYSDRIIYNASMDNKIGIIKFKKPLFSSSAEKVRLFGDTHQARVLYGSLKRTNTSAYSNFMDRNYYKEHNNVILFKNSGMGNSVSLFNGDAYVSPMNLVSMTYYDMLFASRKLKEKEKKSGGILGTVLTVVGVAATIFTAGAAAGVFGAGLAATFGSATTLTGALALSSSAISAGISMNKSGINVESAAKMISEEYPRGLNLATRDTDMVSAPTIDTPWGCNLGNALTDDAIVWFADRLTNIFFESNININLRTSITSLNNDFINPLNDGGNDEYELDHEDLLSDLKVNLKGFDEEEFRQYLIEKLTIIDVEHDNGRLYKGYPTAEWYDVNPDYHRKNEEKVYIHLPINYTCCTEDSNDERFYNNRVWYSQQSFQEEATDNYRVFLTNNYKDIEAECGEITNIFRKSDELFMHTTEGLWKLPANLQEKITTDGLTTYIGTGEFLSIPPKKINDQVGNLGSQQKHATIITKYGIFFVNEIEGKIYLLSDNLRDITNSMSSWFKNNLISNLSNQIYDSCGCDWNNDNMSNIDGTGIISTFDPKNDRILLTKKDYSIIDNSSFKGRLNNNSSDYEVDDIVLENGKFYKITNIEYTEVFDEGFNNFIEDEVVTINTISLPSSTSELGGSVIRDNFEMQKGVFYYTPPDIEGEFTDTIIINTSINKCNYDKVIVNVTEEPNVGESLWDLEDGAYDPSPITSNQIIVYDKYLKIERAFVPSCSDNLDDTVAKNILYIGTDEGNSQFTSYWSNCLSSYWSSQGWTGDHNPVDRITVDRDYCTYDVNKDGDDMIYGQANCEAFNSMTNSNIFIETLSEDIDDSEYDVNLKVWFGDNDVSFEGWIPMTKTKNDGYSTGQYAYIPYIDWYINTVPRAVLINEYYNKFDLQIPNSAGTIRFKDNITVGHKVTIEYLDEQFIIDKMSNFDENINDTYDFYLGEIDYITRAFITVKIEADWKNPEGQSNFNKKIDFEIEYIEDT